MKKVKTRMDRDMHGGNDIRNDIRTVDWYAQYVVVRKRDDG